MPKTMWRIFVGVLGVAGIILLSVAIHLVSDEVHFSADAVRTRGTVIADPGRPVVAFTVDGREIRMRGRVSSRPPSFHAGDPVTVLYLPDEPENARLDIFSERW